MLEDNRMTLTEISEGLNSISDNADAWAPDEITKFAQHLRVQLDGFHSELLPPLRDLALLGEGKFTISEKHANMARNVFERVERWTNDYQGDI